MQETRYRYWLPLLVANLGRCHHYILQLSRPSVLGAHLTPRPPPPEPAATGLLPTNSQQMCEAFVKISRRYDLGQPRKHRTQFFSLHGDFATSSNRNSQALQHMPSCSYFEISILVSCMAVKVPKLSVICTFLFFAQLNCFMNSSRTKCVKFALD